MSVTSTTLRPGLLVALSTTVTGNVDYAKRVIEEDHITESGQRRAVWETERTVIDAKEHEDAIKVRSKARSLMTSVCTRSDFGLLCPEANRPALDRAADEARKLCAEFNATARYTKIGFYVLAARIADDDVTAIRAINGEVRGLLDKMQDGISRLDVDAVREAASKAKQLGTMLSPDAQARITSAVTAIRAMATRMTKAGEQAANEIDTATLTKLAEARTAFLDLDDAAEVAAPEDTTGRGLDLAPHEEITAPAPEATQLDIDELM